MLIINIHQLHLMPKTVLGIFVVGEDEIQDTYRIDTFESEIPDTFLPLILDRKGGIENASVLKELLLCLLHLNNERLTLLVLTIYIEDGTAIAKTIAKILAIEICKVFHHLFTFEKRVEKANQQVLIKRRAEQLLKPEVRIGVDIFGSPHFFNVLYASVCHVLCSL